jgi:hypothetical protein
MMMFERRGSIKTARELRQLVMAMDQNKNHRLSLLEWLCAHFGKSYADLNDFVDEEARARALQEAMKAGEEAKRVEESIKLAEQQKELQASLRAAALERESKLVRKIVVCSLPISLHSVRQLKLSLHCICVSPDRCGWYAGILRAASGKCWRFDEIERAAGLNWLVVVRVLASSYLPARRYTTDQRGVPAAKGPARRENQAERGDRGRQPHQDGGGDRRRGEGGQRAPRPGRGGGREKEDAGRAGGPLGAQSGAEREVERWGAEDPWRHTAGLNSAAEQGLVGGVSSIYACSV